MSEYPRPGDAKQGVPKHREPDTKNYSGKHEAPTGKDADKSQGKK